MFNKCYLLFVYIIDGKIGHWLYQHQGIPMASNLPSVGHVSVGSRDTWSNLPCPPRHDSFLCALNSLACTSTKDFLNNNEACILLWYKQHFGNLLWGMNDAGKRPFKLGYTRSIDQVQHVWYCHLPATLLAFQ
jgi:hypothetical protein